MPSPTEECGESLVSVLIAMAILAIGVSSLLTLMVSSAFSVKRGESKVVALSLANDRIEEYRNTTYADIRLSESSVPTGSDPYVTANSLDATIPASTGQVRDGSGGAPACGSPIPSVCLPTQTVSGSDHNTYRVDTYITHVTPSGGGQVKQVLVVVRLVSQGAVGAITARAASAFS